MKKKVGPFPIWAYPAMGAAVFVAYRFLHRSSGGTTTSTALTGGTTVPTDVGGQSTSLPVFTSLGAWEQAAIFLHAPQS